MLKYRKDIDGLRGLAIILVLIFHFYPTFVPGGFVGVDVFFVISGYLIIEIITQDIQSNNFSFIKFYSRRVLRLLPTLLLVLVFCTFLGWLCLLPQDYSALGKNIAESAAFIGNISAQKIGYFDPESQKNPLLHLWSLAVEEQFYLACPLILMALSKLRARMTWSLVFLAIVSFILNIRGLQVLHEKNMVFYSLQTRFWEILTGGIVGIFINTRTFREGLLSDVVFKQDNLKKYSLLPISFIAKNQSILGFILIALAVLLVTEKSAFPGWWAILPVLGAALIISADRNSNFNRLILSHHSLVFIGLISYPLYLWHWPLLTLAKELFLSQSEHWWFNPAILSITILFSTLSYAIVEKRIRNGLYPLIKTSLLIICLIAVLVIGLLIHKNKGYLDRKTDRSEYMEYFDNTKPNYRFYYHQNLSNLFHHECDFYDVEGEMSGHPKSTPKKISPTCYTKLHPEKKTLLLWGDSHAQHLRAGLDKYLAGDWEILQVATSGCNPVITQETKVSAEYCDYANKFAVKKINSLRPDIVLVAQRWEWNVETASKINHYLKSTGTSRVIFVGQAPNWLANLPKIIATDLWLLTPERTWLGVDKNIISKNKSKVLEFSENNLEFINLISTMCSDKGCLTRIGNNKKLDITTFDYGHMMPIASEFAAKNAILPAIGAYKE